MAAGPHTTRARAAKSNRRVTTSGVTFALAWLTKKRHQPLWIAPCDCARRHRLRRLARRRHGGDRRRRPHATQTDHPPQLVAAVRWYQTWMCLSWLSDALLVDQPTAYCTRTALVTHPISKSVRLRVSPSSPAARRTVARP